MKSGTRFYIRTAITKAGASTLAVRTLMGSSESHASLRLGNGRLIEDVRHPIEGSYSPPDRKPCEHWELDPEVEE